MSRRLLISLVVFVILVTGGVLLLTSERQPAGEKARAGLVGAPAPDFTLPLVGGGEVTLSELRGKIVLVNFWATWCPPCIAEMPSMERLYARFENRGFEMLAVNAEYDGLDILPEFLRKHPHTFPIPVDREGEVQSEYGVFRFPESFLIGRDGEVLEHIIGARDWSDPQTVQRIEDLIKG